MYVFESLTAELAGWIRAEVEFERELAEGARGAAVKHVQEWLSFHNVGVVIDADFGAATRRSVGRFQE